MKNGEIKKEETTTGVVEATEEKPQIEKVDVKQIYQRMFDETSNIVKSYDDGRMKRGIFIDTLLMLRMLSNTEYAVSFLKALKESPDKIDQLITDLTAQANQYKQKLYKQK